MPSLCVKRVENLSSDDHFTQQIIFGRKTFLFEDVFFPERVSRSLLSNAEREG